MARQIIGNHISCDWCGRGYEHTRDLLGYDDKIFCDEHCLGEYLVDRADGDIEVISFDTPEDEKMRAEEARAEW